MPVGDSWRPAKCCPTSQGPLGILGFCFRGCRAHGEGETWGGGLGACSRAGRGGRVRRRSPSSTLSPVRAVVGGPHRDAPGSQVVGTRSGSTCVTGPGAGSTGRHQPRGPGGPGAGGAGTVSTGGSPSLDKRRWEMLRLRGRGRGAGPAAPPGPSAPPRPPWPGHRPLRVKSSSNCALLMLPLPHHGPRPAEPAQRPSRSAYPASTRSPRSDLSPSTSYSKGLGSETGLAAGRSGRRLSLSCPWPEAARKTRAAPAPAVTPRLPMGLCASVS